ncbi:DUF3127 domain-containing protein [Bacterioplanoides sp. SCSIO 12839]|uniref:DUF3127 domain-containing protein n=1 Tax=unclassified Bacterioplanoides TaxID=2630303 RepID=UPI00210213C0|nr:DUF3127 domain-containing protein [Bacterioplanoides sp. SCSIO 12839]UTW49469.1 DUF3127 domain-containing protein [Bacterioplanoides sp. SCSIO 12839]
MSKSFEAQGIIHSIDQTREYGQNGFTKREFVIKLSGDGENPDYPNYVALELIKDKCALMDGYQVGEEVVVTFNLSGRLWNAPGKPEKCFTSLQAWKVDRAGGQPAAQNFDMGGFAPASSGPAFDDDVPF